MQPASDHSNPREFKRLADQGHARGTSRAIGEGFIRARDLLARGLVAAGATPNGVTVFGFLATVGAAACFLVGGGQSHAELRAAELPPFVLIAAACLFLASACDMLDGAVARVGDLGTPFGGFLDSVLDRFSDLAIYIALIVYFTVAGNLTYTVLAAAALANALLISYVKARAESVIPDCGVGYWLRGERSAALLIACLAGNVPAALWQQGILPFLTIVRRLAWTRRVLAARSDGRPPPTDAPPTGRVGLLRPWRFPRGSIPYDIVTAANIAFLIFAPYVHDVFAGQADPLRSLFLSP